MDQVVFHNGRSLEAHIDFSGDSGLFDGSSPVTHEDIAPGKQGKVHTGKSNGKDRLVIYTITMNKKRGSPTGRGNGTIKVGQTLKDQGSRKER